MIRRLIVLTVAATALSMGHAVARALFRLRCLDRRAPSTTPRFRR